MISMHEWTAGLGLGTPTQGHSKLPRPADGTAGSSAVYATSFNPHCFDDHGVRSSSVFPSLSLARCLTESV